ncbi:MAG: nucleotidyl transferase AbiEii/AbiGii toxin family protein [Spirochaetaceae bacterium]|nr:MAG: nucleotidyl transferase AbiEii/AbiGii toxin family protein [Spirochaetaceae bacterium]
MKPMLMRVVEQQSDDFRRQSVAREYLQARILLSLQNAGTFTRWAFLGGTALRFLYDLPRYSEDLDFSLLDAGGDTRFDELISRVAADLRREMYQVTTSARTDRTVSSAFFRFPGLPHDLGISVHRDAVLAVKVELDTNPPAGARTETQVIRRFAMLNLCHYDRSSLFAGKLHAILTRPWTKGRDLYDLVWYLSDPTWPDPNMPFLQAALAQTGWSGPPVTLDSWRSCVREALDRINWNQAVGDVLPFLERREDRLLVSRETIAQLLA